MRASLQTSTWVAEGARCSAQRGDREHRQARTEGETLGHGCCQAQARETTWAARKGDSPERTQAEPGFRKQALHHRQDEFRVPARRLGRARQHTLGLARQAYAERRRAGFSRGVEG
jgi:hypothetical protein